jgi:hypothetical protein
MQRLAKSLKNFPAFITTVDHKKFISVGYTRPQAHWLNHMPRIDAKVHLENIKAELRALPCMPDNLHVPHAYRRTKKAQSHYDGPLADQARDVVRDWYSEDFELLDYDANGE